MRSIPTSLVKTWLFLVKSTSPELSKAKKVASREIKLHFGSKTLAQIYIEQQDDEHIEVVFV